MALGSSTLSVTRVTMVARSPLRSTLEIVLVPVSVQYSLHQ